MKRSTELVACCSRHFGNLCLCNLNLQLNVVLQSYIVTFTCLDQAHIQAFAAGGGGGAAGSTVHFQRLLI